MKKILPTSLRFASLLAFAVALVPFLSAGPLADTAQPYVDDGTVAGIVFLAADGDKVLACEAAGNADIATAKPMREDSMFWIASMTKPITAACVMMLVDEGKLSLDDPVFKYIPAFNAPQKIVSKESEKLGSIANYEGPSAAAKNEKTTDAPVVMRKRAITIRHLLSHTAGLRYGMPEEKPTLDLLPLEKAVELYAASDLLFEPGTDYSYSNTGINTAGRIVEIVSGMAFEDFLQKRLLAPLGMKDTTFWPNEKQLQRLVTCYIGDPKKRTLTASPNLHMHDPADAGTKRYAFPGGGLYSTARDVACFGQLFLNKGVLNGKRLLSEAAVAEMSRRQTPPNAKTAYGIGFNLKPGGKATPPGAYGHGGAYATNISIWPEENIVTVFMVQRIRKFGGPDGGKLRPALEKQALKFINNTSAIRVLNYNILASQPSWEVSAKCKTWDLRMPLVIEIMRSKTGDTGYDFIGTQETSIHPKPELHQVNQLADAMPDYGSLYAAVSGVPNSRVAEKFALSNMIFWRKDRWEIDPDDHGTYWLSDTPEIPGSETWSPINEKTGKRTSKGGKRNVTYGLFHEIVNGKRTGKKVYFYNTHLNVFVIDARVKSALLMMERISTRKDKSAPVILTGDFNSRRDNSRGDGATYQYLTGNAIDFEGKHHKPPQVLTEAFATAGPQDQLPRIDFIFSGTGLKPAAASNVNIFRDGVRPSDHAPIAAILEWD